MVTEYVLKRKLIEAELFSDCTSSLLGREYIFLDKLTENLEISKYWINTNSSTLSNDLVFQDGLEILVV